MLTQDDRAKKSQYYIQARPQVQSKDYLYNNAKR